MPGAPRPNKKAMKIAYTVLNTPDDQRQDKQRKPTDRMLREWFKDSSQSQ